MRRGHPSPDCGYVLEDMNGGEGSGSSPIVIRREEPSASVPLCPNGAGACDFLGVVSWIERRGFADMQAFAPNCLISSLPQGWPDCDLPANSNESRARRAARNHLSETYDATLTWDPGQCWSVRRSNVGLRELARCTL